MEDSYLYPVARTRALETKLLDKLQIDRMIDAKDCDDVMRILAETDYACEIAESYSSQDYEKMLLEETQYVFNYLKEVSPSAELAKIFLLRYDVQNLKVLMKSKMLGEEYDHLLLDIGNYPLNVLKEAVRESDFQALDSALVTGLNLILAEWAVKQDPQAIDIVLDRCQYQMMFRWAEESGEAFLLEFVSTLIDISNIRTFFRVRETGQGKDFLQSVILPSGKLGEEFYRNFFDEPVEAIVSQLVYTDYSQIIEEGMEIYQQTKTWTRFEKLLDNYLMDVAKKGKYASFSIEPLIGFMVAKEYEIKGIRMIMVGKNNKIPNDVIRERLRDAYV